MERNDGPGLAELTVRACEYCGGPVPGRRKDARYCSTSHRVMASRKRKHAREIHESLVTRGLTDQSLEELHERASAPQHWADIEAGQDHLDDDGLDDEQSARIRSMFQEDAERTPMETWKRWRSFGKRHGTEHPEQTADRVARHEAAERAADARRDANTAGRAQDRFDTRTTANVAQNGSASRRLNVRHVERPPVSGQGWDFQAQSFDGGPYRASGHEVRYGGTAWDMTDGFRF